MPTLSPQVLAWRAAQPKEWALIVENPRFFQKPDKLTTAEDAFTLLGHILWCWDKYLKDFERMSDPQDHALAAFVQANPGQLESLLADFEHQKQLAQALTKRQVAHYKQWGDHGHRPESLLELLLESTYPRANGLLHVTLGALDASVMLRLAMTLPETWKSYLDRWGSGRFHGGLSGAVLHRVGPHGFPTLRATLEREYAPSLLDAMEASAHLPANQIPHFRFPDILPDEVQLVAMHPEAITQTVADYMGMTPEALSARLVRGKFLAEGESVGALIWRDAKTLLELGVSRKALAKALSEVMLLDTRMLRILTNPDEPMMMGADVDVANWVTRAQATWDVQWDASAGFWQGGPPLGVEVISYMGHHHDPFHTADTYYLSPEVQNDCDCKVRNENTGEVLTYSGMAPYLIRRACFFEGSVPYRLDPAKACRVLAPLLVGS